MRNSPARRIGTAFARKRRPLASITALLLVAATSEAQRPQAELQTIYPPVAAAGQTVDVDLGGVNLDDLTTLWFSEPRITAERVMLPENEFRKFPAQNGTKFKVTIPADVPPGTVEVRAVGYFGMSTSRPFEVLPKDTAVVVRPGDATTFEKAPELAREAVGLARFANNRVDYWKFSAKKGERLLVKVRSEHLDSKADATLILTDANRRELDRNRDYDGLDPMIDFTAPADGDYFVGVHDYLFVGAATHFYTVRVTARPHIDFAFPPSVEPGKTARVTLYGRNLPGGSPGGGMQIGGKPVESIEVDITAPAEIAIPASFSARRPSHGMLAGFDFSKDNSNSIRMGFASAPVIPEIPGEKTAQKVAIPCEVAGRFDERADADQYRFTAKKGTKYWVETISDRFARGTDPYILVEKVTKADDGTETLGKVGEDDDEPGTGGPFFDTLTRDAFFGFTADQDGEYQVTILNQFTTAGPEKVYRLAIREAKPDFQLLVIPERPVMAARQFATVAPVIRRNGTAAVKVAVTRQDGFDQPITISAEGLPAGVTCPPVVVAPEAAVAWLVFKAGPDAKSWHGSISVVGKARIGEAELSRTARSGTIAWTVANNTTEKVRARLDQSIPLAVSENETEVIGIELADPAKPLVVEMGQKIDIPVKITGDPDKKRKGNVTLTPVGLHGMVKPPAVNVAQDKTDGVVAITVKDQNNVFKPVVGKHSFVIQGRSTAKYQHNPQAAKRAEEEKAHVAELVKKLTADLAKAKTDAAAAKTAFDAATKNLAAASPEAKPAAEKALAEAKAKNDASLKLVADLDARVKAGAAAQKGADARAKAAGDKAKEKDTPFVVYSLPIVLEIKPAPEPEKK